MTDSSKQELFLEQFQEARDLLEGDEVDEALEVMLEVREQGFVNKELDTIIDGLRDEPSDEAVAEAGRWTDDIVERLGRFGGDVFQLVEEFSEASLGLSEAEWVPVEESSSANEIEDVQVDDFDADAFMDLEDVDEDLDISLDIGDGDEVESSVVEEEPPEVDQSSEDDEEDPLEFDLGLTKDSQIPEVSEEESPPALSRHERETKPHRSPEATNSNDRETKPNEAVKHAESPDETVDGEMMRETERRPAVARDMLSRESSESSGEFDLFDSEVSEASEVSDEAEHGFVEEPTRQSDPLQQMMASEASAARDESSGGFDEREETGEFDDIEESEGEFDFDLSFENPTARVQAPSTAQAQDQSEASEAEEPDEAEEAARDEEDEEDEEDEFDFDLGFENPASRVQMPSSAPEEAASEDLEESGAPERDEEDEEDEFDFDLGFENPAQRIETPATGSQAGPLAESSGPSQPPEEEDDDEVGLDLGLEEELGLGEESSAARPMEKTPASMPSIPRFRPPSEAETGGSGKSTADESLDDDEFFELAESLSSESSAVSTQVGQPYRGEPMMTDTPMPGTEESEASEESPAREREDTPNPFAHEAPTGVQQALVDANSVFVLEEIRPSEASEISDAQEGEAAVEALMNEARRLYEDGEFESAHDLLEAVLAREESHEDAKSLLATVGGELERVYQSKLGSLTKVPELNVSMSDIPSMNLDHRFGFVLSQIDGMSTFEDILELSSMTRLETLDVLAHMLEREIIDV
jgi:hypothetical protein